MFSQFTCQTRGITQRTLTHGAHTHTHTEHIGHSQLTDTHARTEISRGSLWVAGPLKTHRAGKMRASNSVLRCRRIMFFEGGMPRAVAMVSPEKDGSNTTRPPCTPLSAGGLAIGGNEIRTGQRSPLNCRSEWHNQRAIDMAHAPFRLSAYSPRSMDRTQRMKRWFVHTMGSVSTVSDCTRLMASVCRSYFTMRNTWMPVEEKGMECAFD